MKIINRLSKMFLVLGLLVSSVGNAADTCISSIADFNAAKSKFPAAFQSQPIMFTADNGLVKAALRIRGAGGKIKVEGWKLIKLTNSFYKDDSYVKTLCYNGSGSMKVVLEDGTSYNVQVKNNAAVISGVSLQKSSQANFSGFINTFKTEQSSSAKATGTRAVQ